MKVGIYGQTNNEITIKYTEYLIEILQDRKIDFFLEKNFCEGFEDATGNGYPTFDGYEGLDKSFESERDPCSASARLMRMMILVL